MLFALGFLTMFTLGGISGVMLAMIPFDIHVVGHVLHRRPHPLRAVRRLAVHDLRRHLLLVPEDDRPDVRRAPRQAALLADVHLLQPDLRPDAPDRHPGHAAPRRRLRAAVRGLEPVHLDLALRPRAHDADLPLQHGRQLARRPARRRQPVARADARVAGLLAAADLQLRRGADRRRRPLRVRRPRRRARHLQAAGRSQAGRGRRERRPAPPGE